MSIHGRAISVVFERAESQILALTDCDFCRPSQALSIDTAANVHVRDEPDCCCLAHGLMATPMFGDKIIERAAFINMGLFLVSPTRAGMRVGVSWNGDGDSGWGRGRGAQIPPRKAHFLLVYELYYLDSATQPP